MTNRQELIHEVMKQLEEGVQSVFTSDKYIQMLDMMSKFHNYSINNCILILSQYPSASHVASFQTWKKLGHPVLKGSKGIKVLVPIPYTYEAEKTVLDALGNASTETVEAKGLRFRVGHVFDASQVEGELPSLINELEDNPAHLQDAVDQIINSNGGISYDHDLKKGQANGYYRLDTKEICIREEMSSLQTFKTIIHEKAHSILHNSDSEKYTRSEAEVQAESIAYVVCQSFGLDTSDYSFNYVATWSSNKETKELKRSLAVIEKTAKELMSWITNSTDLKLQEVA